MNPYFPLLLDLRGRRCLVVGGGPVGARKAESLRDAGANVTLVSKVMSPDARALRDVMLIERPYNESDLDGMWLVVTAVDDRQVTATVAADADARQIFVNAADDPPYCSAILPAVHRDGDVVVAVSTGGASPAGAGWIRDEIVRLLGDAAARVVEHVSRVRAHVRQTRTSEGLPWRALINDVANAVRANDVEEIDRRTNDWLAKHGLPALVIASEPERSMSPASLSVEPSSHSLGVVHLLGAGPGDAELLTVRAVRLLGTADVVLHDALLGTEVLALAPPQAERIDVGKRAGQSSAQAMICALMVELALEGKTVVRLKGGDPFVFGRGGEEAEALRAAGIPYTVTPGVSSSIAAPAAAGIPVTHRNVSAAYTVVTGHRTDGAEPVDWPALARVGGTIIVLMGVGRRREIANALMSGGLAPSTPVAAITNGTHPDQHVVRTSLAALAHTPVDAPATIVIGAVAALDLRPVSDWLATTVR